MHSTDPILITDLKGVITDANPAFVDLFGYSHDEIIGNRTAILRSSRTNDELYQEMWRKIREEGSWQGEIYNRKKNGEEIPILLSITPVRQDDAVIGYMAIEIDITEKKRIEKEILREKAFSESLIETANNMIVSINLSGEILVFNRRCAELTGYKKEEAVGRSWFDVCQFNDKDGHPMFSLDGLRKKRFPSHFESVIKTALDHHIHIVWSNAEIRDPAGGIIGVLAIGQDVTRQKRLELEILRSEKLATIGNMAAKVAHEIRNPLSSISLNAELLGDEIFASEEINKAEARSLLNAIIDEVERLAQLTDEYLHFSRLPSIEKSKGDLSELLKEVLHAMEPEANAVGVQFTSNIDKELGQVRFDPNQIRRVFVNLIKNAIEAMPNGGHFRVSAQNRNNSVSISFSDSGKGIMNENYERIFEPFFTRKQMGTGLGLAISRQIVEEHDGELYCEPGEMRGATFRLLIPKA